MTDWQRLEQVIKWAGKNANSFAKELGLNRTENLYQIKKGNNRISKSLAAKIISVFPAISKTWLVFGDGSMFVGEEATFVERKIVIGTPFYDGDNYTILSSELGKLEEPVYNIYVPLIGDCDIAIRVNSNVLEPKIQLGSILMLKKIAPCDIMYGYKYIILINGLCMLRVIKRDGVFTSDYVIIKTLNPDSEASIMRDEIEHLYIIKASIASQ